MHRTRRSTGRKQYVTWTATDVTFPCRASSASCLKSCAEARSPCGTGESNSKAIDGWAGMARVVGSRCRDETKPQAVRSKCSFAFAHDKSAFRQVKGNSEVNDSSSGPSSCSSFVDG